MTFEDLLQQSEQERLRCIAFGRDPHSSKRYRRIERQLTVLREDSKPAVRSIKSALVYILAVAIPSTLWVWAYIISETVKLIIS